MAAFFNRWPETGRVNFEYNPSAGIEDEGIFQGKSGKGVGDYGLLLSESSTFDSCAIQRAFDFLHGRHLTTSESKILIPKYLTIYKKHGNSLKEVMREMIKSREFSGNVDGDEEDETGDVNGGPN